MKKLEFKPKNKLPMRVMKINKEKKKKTAG